MTVKRYNAGCAYAGEEEMVQADDGAYVRFDDCAALLKERDALARELCMSEAKCKGYFSDAAVASLKCDALAAENVELKKFIVNHKRAAENWNSWADPEDKIPDSPETPATDAAIANIQAQGVDELADFAGKEYQRFAGDKPMQRKWKGIVLLCTDFAAQLRKEAGHA